ncbi:hypothetical protein M153_5000031663 [Pseudoloma neurophilia]|uniref:Uncharacterized protein n=1 Tax=Pseudoloma neurophilia TaxID=146866 RepID=A0A0R0M6M3_9MICR|nr:hypothetical protein M153_5000031663 [Pseudoloma neurophilia]
MRTWKRTQFSRRKIENFKLKNVFEYVSNNCRDLKKIFTVRGYHQYLKNFDDYNVLIYLSNIMGG